MSDLKIFTRNCEFMMSCANLRDLPDYGLSEVAFIGRSNVGKSSLINALVGRNDLARTSNTPGRTQLLNFFNLAGEMILVDLPGYGYAKVSRSQVKDWTKLVRKYLVGRPTLRRVCVLVDSRHGLKDSDIDMMKMLDEAAVSYQVILTKIDKKKAKDLDGLKEKIETTLKKHPAAHPIVLLTSSAKKTGLDELKTSILQII